MDFTKEQLLTLIGWENEEGFSEKDVIIDEIVDTSRWETIHRLVFAHKGKLYETSYRLGATECQESEPFEYDTSCFEVVEYTKTITDYKRKED